MNPQRLLSSISSPRSLRTRFTIRFLRALRRISDRKCSRRYHRVKVAAEASMAFAVGPRRAWSRAMLLKLRWRSRRIHVRAPVIMVGGKRMRKKRFVGDRRKIQSRKFSSGQEDQLRKLVPGGELLDTYTLLGETAHYRKCLTTQKLFTAPMAALAEY